MYSRLRSERVWPRTMRPTYGQPKKPITSTRAAMRTPEPSRPRSWLGSTETRAIVKSSCGKASMTSMTRLRAASIQPPK
ncbi:hypothetical protein SNARM312S_01497 [Streptomyces narbonensis]